MVAAGGREGAGRRERPDPSVGARVEELAAREKLVGVVVRPSDQEDLPSRQERRGVVGPVLRERTGRREGPGRRVVDLGAREVVPGRVHSARHHDLAVRKERRRVDVPGHRERAGSGELAGARVIDLGGGERVGIEVRPPDDQDPAVRQERGRVLGAGLAQRPGRREAPDASVPRRIEELRRRGVDVGARLPTGHQDLAGREEGGRVLGPPRHEAARDGEAVGRRVVQLRRPERSVPPSRKEHLSAGQDGPRVPAPRLDERPGGRGDGPGPGVVLLHGLRIERDGAVAADEEHFSVRQQRRDVPVPVVTQGARRRERPDAGIRRRVEELTARERG